MIAMIISNHFLILNQSLVRKQNTPNISNVAGLIDLPRRTGKLFLIGCATADHHWELFCAIVLRLVIRMVRPKVTGIHPVHMNLTEAQHAQQAQCP